MPGTTLRLFFALWPDSAARAALGALARDVARETGGRAVAADNVHLTLAFLGEQPADIVPKLCASAAAVELAPFGLVLAQVGCFAKTGVAWLGAGAVPPELIALHRRLADALAGMGVTLDARPFAPHLTLARRIERPVQRRLPQPVVWNVVSFALIASELDRSGARYRVVDSWSHGNGA